VTCNVQDKKPFFKNKIFCDLWIRDLQITKNLKKFDLYAFCLNYDHFHLLLRPDERFANISQIMQSLKKNTAININNEL
jgi:REP element-mobilizing transposase RayT